MKKTDKTTFTVSGDVHELVYSSMAPEDTGSDEEGMQDYVHTMLTTPAVVYGVTE